MGQPMARQSGFTRRCKEYLESIMGVYSPETVRTYREVLGVMARDVRELRLEPRLDRWGEREVLALKDLYVDRYAPKTMHQRMAVLNNVLLEADNPIMVAMRRRRRLRLPEATRGIVRWVDEQDAERLLAGTTGTLRIVMVLGLGLGLRRGEMLRVDTQDIQARQLLVHGKGARERVLPLEGPVAVELHRYTWEHRSALVSKARPSKEPGALLLYMRSGELRTYQPNTLYEMVRHHGRTLGMELSVHDLRRTFARALKRRGVTPDEIKELLGHKSVDTTIDYLDLDMDSKRDALQVLYASWLRGATLASK